MISVTPAHHIARFLTIHTLFCPFFLQSPVPLSIWLVIFESIVLHLEFACTSSHHTYATLPTLPTSHPSALLHDPSRWYFPGFGCSNNGLWTWLVLGVLSLGQPPCGSFIDNGPALCSLSVSLSSLFRLSCRWATNSSFRESVV